MGRAINNGNPHPDAGSISTMYDPENKHIVVLAALDACAPQGERPVEYITDAEITQVLSAALDDALVALSEPNPETCLRMRASEARAGIHAMLRALSEARVRDAKLVKEYRRAMAMQNLGLDLALKLVESIRRYARVYERELSLELS